MTKNIGHCFWIAGVPGASDRIFGPHQRAWRRQAVRTLTGRITLRQPVLRNQGFWFSGFEDIRLHSPKTFTWTTGRGNVAIPVVFLL
jgi:hypothetical protein